MSAKVFRAAMIPYYIEDDGSIEMLFMQPSNQIYGGSDFQLAKGHIEYGETELEAALREGTEELGLRPDNIAKLDLLGNYLGRTTVFICEVLDKEAFDDFTEETDATKWISAGEFAAIGRDIHVNVVQEAEQFILSNSVSK